MLTQISAKYVDFTLIEFMHQTSTVILGLYFIAIFTKERNSEAKQQQGEDLAGGIGTVGKKRKDYL